MQLQAAFFMGEKGNSFCKEIVEYYNSRPFLNPEGTFNMTISPVTMLAIAHKKGYVPEDTEQHLADDTIIYPGYYVTPCSRHITVSPDAFAEHRIYGSWRTRKFGRKMELFIKHILVTLRYAMFKR